MPSTHRKASALVPLALKAHTPLSAAIDTEACFSLLDGRWKLVILFNLFDGSVLQFSDLERRVTGISQKVPAQQLRQLEADGNVEWTVHERSAPNVDDRLADWGRERCPALDGLLQSFGRRPGSGIHAS